MRQRQNEDIGQATRIALLEYVAEFQRIPEDLKAVERFEPHRMSTDGRVHKDMLLRQEAATLTNYLDMRSTLPELEMTFRLTIENGRAAYNEQTYRNAQLINVGAMSYEATTKTAAGQ